MKELLNSYSYHLPSDDKQLAEFAKKVLQEALKLSSGQVINGVLAGVILEKDLKNLMENL